MPHLATISTADRLIVSSFEKKYGKSDTESIVRFFRICQREKNMGWAPPGWIRPRLSELGLTALGWAQLGLTRLGCAWLDWAGLGWNRIGWN